MKEIIKNIEAQLKEKVPQLKMVVPDWGQIITGHDGLEYPYVLVDIKEVTYTQHAGGNQIADIIIGLTVGTAHPDEFPQDADPYLLYELVEAVNNALQLFTLSDCTPLLRAGMEKIDNAEFVCAYRVYYTTTLTVAVEPRWKQYEYKGENNSLTASINK